jgi:hypothetical protein
VHRQSLFPIKSHDDRIATRRIAQDFWGSGRDRPDETGQGPAVIDPRPRSFTDPATVRVGAQLQAPESFGVGRASASDGTGVGDPGVVAGGPALPRTGSSNPPGPGRGR